MSLRTTLPTLAGAALASVALPLVPATLLPPPASAQLLPDVEVTGVETRALPQPWRELTFDKLATHTAFTGNHLWVGTSGGGVYCWDTVAGTYDKWTRVNDGLPDNDILDLMVDGQEVWVASFRGLGHYDGTTWEEVAVGGAPLTEAVMSLAVGDDGSLWVGTYDQGLFVFDGASWTHHHPGNSGLSDVFVTSIVLGPGGVAWLGVWGDGVDRFDGTTWTNHGPGGGGSSQDASAGGGGGGGLLSAFAYPKFVDPDDGRVWVWSYDDDFDPQVGLQSFDGTTWTDYTVAASGIHSDFIHSVTKDHAGDYWFQGSSAISRLSAGGAWTTYAGVPSLFDTNIHRGRSLSVRHDGELWAGTAEGIARFDGSGFVGSATPELADPDIREVAVGADGTIWLATGGGLEGLRHGQWTRFTAADSPLPHDDVEAVRVLADGSLLAGTFGGAALRDGRGEWTVWTAATSGLPINQTETVAAQADGTLWFGHGLFGSGTSRLEPDGTWTQWTQQIGGLPSHQVWDIEVADGSGAVWFGTAGGLARFDGSDWQTWTTADGLLHDWVRDVAIAPNGRVWMATPDGVAMLSSGGITTWTAADGLAEDFTLCVGFDGQGRPWAGSNVQGVSRFDGGGWTVFQWADGLTNDRVQSLAADGQGTLWLGTGWGLGAYRKFGVPWP